jgi:hypothetical protein
VVNCFLVIHLSRKTRTLNPISAPLLKDANNVLAEVLITGQQILESRKQEADVNEKRLRLYVQAGLTFLLVASSALYVLLRKKKLSSAEIGALTGVVGVAVGYWFK